MRARHALKRPLFLRDLAEELTYLNEKVGSDVAERWYQALLQTIEDLKQQPFLGRERRDLKPKGIRSWRIKEFSRWLIFYQVDTDGSLILLRVRYGMLDLPALPMKN